MIANSKCNICGGSVRSVGANKYQCEFCGNVFQEQAPAPISVAAAPAAKPANGGVNVFDKNINGIIEITCLFPDGESAGSGLLIDKAGHVITNTHVVCDEEGDVCKHVVARICGMDISAKVLALGDDMGGNGAGVDLALLKLEALPPKASPVAFADFNAIRNGEQVYVIGNSLGDGTCITSGIVSDKSRTLNGKRLLMTDCAINGGNSGGPIFNSNGDVIGVIVCSRVHFDGSATEGMNYAIPADTVEEFICGKHRTVTVSRMARTNTPDRFASCPVCAFSTRIGSNEQCCCTACGHEWQHSNVVLREARKALAPCPRCGSWNTTVENKIFYCADCDFEG